MSKCDYEDAHDMKCLLCNPLGGIYCREDYKYMSDVYLENVDSACQQLGCPWIVILGEECYNHKSAVFEDEYCAEYNVYDSYNKEAMNRRIKQLRNWIKIYENHKP